ncbi:MAG: cellulose synthase operon protein YhjQ/BcsQ [Planctomycetota bacterium]
MSPSPTPHRPNPAAARSGGGSPGAGPSVDPVKMFLKYRWLLLAAAVLGGGLGVVSHFVLLRVYPIFQSEVVMECLPPDTDPSAIYEAQIDAEEIERFMGTQVSTIKSPQVLGRVVNDARLLAEAPDWTKPYAVRGRFDVVNAMKDLEGIVSAGMIPNTYLIRVSVSTNYPRDSAGIVRLIKENYTDQLRNTTNTDVVARKDALRRAIEGANRQLADLNTRRSRLVREEGVDSLADGRSASAELLRLVNFELVKIQQGIEAITVQLEKDEKQLERDAGIQYDNTLRLAVESAPEVASIKSQINSLESRLAAIKQQGLREGHREYRLLISEIEGQSQQLDIVRERLLREAFESRVDQSRLTIQQLKAQEADLLTQAEELTEEVTELTRILGEINDIDRTIESTIDLIGKYELDMADIETATSLASASRVVVRQHESVPDLPAFPKITLMVPLGVILLTGLVTGIVLVIELLDQRVKSAADVASIPGVTLLGMVPDAGEDPSRPEHPESVFRDLPGSVLSEHYRQMRTRVVKAMSRGEHRTLLVAGAMPGSGGTSMVSNLGSALLAAGHSVLVLDANFRRSRLHRAFDAPEAPGLADILAGDRVLSDVVSRKEGQPDLISAGTPDARLVERLGSAEMDAALSEARSMYDFVLIDVAPVVVAGDASSLANRCDASLLVVRAMQGKRGMVARLRNELGEGKAEFIGVAINGVRSAAGGYMRKNIRTTAEYTAQASGAGEAA